MKKVREKKPDVRSVFPKPLSRFAPPNDPPPALARPGTGAPSCQGQLMDVAEACIRRAEANIKRWGEQDPETLALCMAEELGELARSILSPRQSARRESSRFARVLDVRDVEAESVDLGALCLQMIWLMREDRIQPTKTGGKQ